jgi:DNA repair protein RecO (recombination protein O)
MVEKIEGIVLRTLKHSDSLMIADIYTLQHGRMSFLVPVTHSKRSKVRNVLFQPLSILSFTASVRAGKTLFRISEVQPLVIYATMHNDVVKSSMVLYMSEVLTFALRESGKDEGLYSFIFHSLTLLDNLEEGYADFHLVFMVQLLRFLGIYPNVEEYRPGYYFDLEQGCAVAEHPFHPNFLLPKDAEHLIVLFRTGYDSMHQLALNRKLRGAYLAILSLYYRLHIPDFPELKSADVLRELFD